MTTAYFGLFVWVNDYPITGSVLDVRNIAKPRKEPHEYKEMEVATVHFRGRGKYEAVIGKIGRKYAIYSDILSDYMYS